VTDWFEKAAAFAMCSLGLAALGIVVLAILTACGVVWGR
jgi:hypothetical protein